MAEIAASLSWLRGGEGARPDRWDLTGAALALAGAAVILWGPRVEAARLGGIGPLPQRVVFLVDRSRTVRCVATVCCTVCGTGYGTADFAPFPE